MIWLLSTLSVICSYGMTGALRRYALKRSLLDRPNSRSSHIAATPRGGGMAFVVVFLVVLVLLWWWGAVDGMLAVALLGAGASIAVLGFADDHGHIAARWRLLGHFVASGWALFWLGGLPPVIILEGSLDLGWVGHTLAIVFLVWLLNLYNFMDGIDGIASIQAVSACVGAMLCYQLAVLEGLPVMELGVLEWVLACSVVGFLCWNFPKAHIFMGDAGSGFLGLVMGIFALYAGTQQPRLLWCWLILLGVFIVDATFTLLRRLLRGEAIYEAHRSHAYQGAARRVGRHVPVTLSVVLINVVWLVPWALSVASGRVDGVNGLAIAYLPLAGLCVWLRAGAAE
ncbi:MraY family glycosyltransferase [Stutzerimonas zhaodongensis]|uniref:MraY family glycosyltransferase n=1 Tax=Stutzerimonas zhaodongensis TaxID=1176257 RepID=UPI001F4E11E1|nr:glycosyltransferase family 4 protein [Stutzerimonas zhaodongensis]UNG18166.1 glycosyltransferase family 4 protein [Stutzerimonas zhaodongensis]